MSHLRSGKMWRRQNKEIVQRSLFFLLTFRKYPKNAKLRGRGFDFILFLKKNEEKSVAKDKKELTLAANLI